MQFSLPNYPPHLSWTHGQEYLRCRWPNRRIWTALTVASFVACLLFALHSTGRMPVISLHQNWSRYAYASYATNDASLCNSLMLFERLERLGSRPDRILLHPHDWSSGSGISQDSAALLKKLKTYRVKLIPIAIQEFNDVDPTWSKGFTKLLAFNQTQYSRVLSMDSDATILQSMDELFHLPPAPIAMPRAYWLDRDLNAQIILFTPSSTEYHRMEKAYLDRPEGNTEMDMLNDIYREQGMVLPHRPYGLVSGEFKSKSHVRYMGTDEWDPEAAIKEAKFVHFSDWPLPKPWQDIYQTQWDEVFPPCDRSAEDCRDRKIWLELYRDFLRRRKDVCGDSFMPSTSVPE